MKNPLTPAGIEPATFRIVAQHLSHCATAVPGHIIKMSLKNKTLFQLSFCCLNSLRQTGVTACSIRHYFVHPCCKGSWNLMTHTRLKTVNFTNNKIDCHIFIYIYGIIERNSEVNRKESFFQGYQIEMQDLSQQSPRVHFPLFAVYTASSLHRSWSTYRCLQLVRTDHSVFLPRSYKN